MYQVNEILGRHTLKNFFQMAVSLPGMKLARGGTAMTAFSVTVAAVA